MSSLQLFHPFNSLFADLLLSPVFNTLPTHKYYFGAADIAETPNSFVCTLDTPGLSAHDVNVEVSEDILTISGKRSSETLSDDSFHRMERSFGSFSRSFTLPSGTDPKNLTANMDNGVLTVTIPKVEPPKPIVHSVPITNNSLSNHESKQSNQQSNQQSSQSNHQSTSPRRSSRRTASRRYNTH